MFFVRLLWFVLLLGNSFVHADEFKKRLTSDDGRSAPIYTKKNVGNVSLLANLASTCKVKKKLFTHTQIIDADDYDKPVRTSYSLSISSPQLAKLQNIASCFKEKIGSLQDHIIDKQDPELLFLPMGYISLPDRLQKIDDEEDLFPIKHEMAGAGFATTTGLAATTGTLAITPVAVTTGGAGISTVALTAGGGTGANIASWGGPLIVTTVGETVATTTATVTVGTISWPLVVGGIVVVGAGSLIIYIFMEEQTASALAVHAVQEKVVASQVISSSEVVSTLSKVKDVSRLKSLLEKIVDVTHQEKSNIKNKFNECCQLLEPIKIDCGLHGLIDKKYVSKIDYVPYIPQKLKELHDTDDEETSTGILVVSGPEASFVAPALVWVVGGAGGTILGGPIIAPVVGVIYTGITIAQIIKNNAQRNNGGSGGGSGDEDDDKKKDKDKNKKEKKDRENRIKAENKRIEDSLPSGFKGTRDKHGCYPKDKYGNSIDNKGNTWRWNEKTQKFDVFNKHGKFMVSANPAPSGVSSQPDLQMKADNLPQVEKKGCGDWQKPQEPVTFKSPAADQNDRPIHTGGSAAKVETATNTAHDRVPQVTSESPGCGRPAETPEQRAARTALHAKPVKVSKLDGYAKKELTPRQIREIEQFQKAHPHGKYQESNKHHVNSRENISKPPRNGQDALDNSFNVRDAKQRIAVQDNNVVILQPTSQGEYHGYIHNDLSSLESKYKEALVENGFLKDAKSRKLTK